MTRDLEWEPLLTTAEAAKLLNYSIRTLEDWRSTGRGPAFIRVNGGQVRYRLSDLKAFIEGCERVEPGRQSAA